MYIANSRIKMHGEQTVLFVDNKLNNRSVGKIKVLFYTLGTRSGSLKIIWLRKASAIML
jgi:hypothetical protein